MDRRDFLRLAASIGALRGLSLGCSSKDTGAFAHGVASGEPAPDGCVVWTRLTTAASSQSVCYEVAKDPDFKTVVASGCRDVDASTDHCLRVELTGLEPATTYHYRFTAGGVQSPVGHTRTAPSPDDPRPVRFAVACCQDFVGRYYHAWQALLDEPPVDFVLFLGDYIYEYETGSYTVVPDPDSIPADRRVHLPDGEALTDPIETRTAVTLEDYRSLYRAYQSDEVLQRVHQSFPFVLVMDDHEFANDCWQDHANDWSGRQGDEHVPDRWRAAMRAYVEHVPFAVGSAPDSPGAFRAHRTLRFGKHLELFLTDERWHRSDHVVPEGPKDPAVGKLVEDSILGSRVFAKKSGFDVEEAASGATMLGPDQRDWFVAGVRASDATWKIWGSETVVAQMVVDLSDHPEVPQEFRDKFYFKLDQWDGFRTERAAILRGLADVPNFAAVSGDLHGFYASELRPDFDDPTSPASSLEFCVAGITSEPVKVQTEKLVSTNVLLNAFGLGPIVEQFDPILQKANPHIHYASSAAYGIAIVELDATAMTVTFLELDDVHARDYPGVARRVKFRAAAGTHTLERLS